MEAETTAWVNAVVSDGGSVSAGRQTSVDNLIVGLKSDGVFTKLDRLWLFRAENTQSALRDIVAASAATAVNSPTFTPDGGYLGNGSTQYIDTNFNATTAPTPKFVQNSASHFAWSNTSTDSGAGMFGSANNNNIIYPRASNTFFGSANAAGGSTLASTDATGFWACNRSASNAEQYYKNGSSITSDAEVSIAPSNSNFTALGLSGGFWAGTVLFAGIGQSLTATEHTSLYTRLNTFMQSGSIAYAAFSTPQFDGRTVTQMISY